MREGQRQLHLLRAGDAAVEGFGVIENGADLRIGFDRHRQLDLAADDVVRQVGGEAQLGQRVDEIEGDQQVVGQPAAMGLDVDGEVDRFGEALPAFEHGDGVAQFARTDLRLDVDVVDAEGGAPFERRLQAVDVGGERRGPRR